MFNCLESETKFKSNLTVIKKIDEEHIVLKESMDMNMGFEFNTIYFAMTGGDHVGFFLLNDFDESKELTYSNLYPDDNGRRELRYLIFKLTDDQYDKLNNFASKLGKLEFEIENYDLTNSELINEMELFEMQTRTWRELTKTQDIALANLVGGSRYFCE